MRLSRSMRASVAASTSWGEQGLVGGAWGERGDHASGLEGAEPCPGPCPGARLLWGDAGGQGGGGPTPHGGGTGTHGSESSQVVLSLLLQLDLFLQPEGREEGVRGTQREPRPPAEMSPRDVPEPSVARREDDGLSCAPGGRREGWRGARGSSSHSLL